jgi:hypothetical protein
VLTNELTRAVDAVDLALAAPGMAGQHRRTPPRAYVFLTIVSAS